MVNPAEFRELVSGRRRGLDASVLRGLLRAVEVPYSLGVRWRNRRYDAGHSKTHHVGVPVICVGNLTLGGTGKTPMVKWLAQWLRERNLRVGIVSRGYGARDGHENDESRELRQAMPEIPHVQNPDRVVGARKAIDAFGCQAIVLDDGFQHRRLRRDLDIVLLDALEPFGFEHVFPRGTLREPVTGLRRASVVCLSRSDVISREEREAIRRRVAELAPHAAWSELSHAASRLINAGCETQSLAALAGRRVVAFCGIGNPAGFQHTLAATGCRISAWRTFADHHAYSDADLAELRAVAASCNAEMLVCTHKDLVKLGELTIADVPLWAVMIEMRFLSGQQALEARITDTLRVP